MAYEYSQRSRRRADAPRERDLLTQAGPEALRSGAVQPTAEQMGHRVDLPEAMRAKMENAFGADLGAVRLYESQAVADAGAEAVAQGTNISFAPGMLDFSSFGGQSLLGHELSHVVSQARGEVRGSGFLSDPALEARADREGAMAAAGQTVAVPTASLSPASAASAAGPMQASKDEDKKNMKYGKLVGKKDKAVKDMVTEYDANQAEMIAAMKEQGFSDQEIEAQLMFQRVNSSKGMLDRFQQAQGDIIEGSEATDVNAAKTKSFKMGRGVFTKKGAAKREAREQHLINDILVGSDEEKKADELAAAVAYQNQQPDRDEAALRRALTIAESADKDASGSFLAGQQRIGAHHQVQAAARQYQSSLSDTRRWGYRKKREEDAALGISQGIMDSHAKKEEAALEQETADLTSGAFTGEMHGGALNQVYKYDKGEGKAAKGGYFKPESPTDYAHPTVKMAGIQRPEEGPETKMSDREIAFSVLGKLLGSSVALESRQARTADEGPEQKTYQDGDETRTYALKKNDTGVLMEEAAGKDWDLYNWDYYGPETFMGSDEAAKLRDAGESTLTPEQKAAKAKEAQIEKAIKSGADQTDGATVGERLGKLAPGVGMKKKSTTALGAETLATERKNSKGRFSQEGSLDAADPRFQREMNELFLLDTLAGQPDRHGGNFKISKDKDGSVGVKAIDNDVAFGSDASWFGKRTDHYVGLPEQMQVDAKMAQNIRGMTKETLETSMGHLLRKEEIDALWEKFQKLTEYINEMEKKGLLVDEWNEDTAKREVEMSGGLHASDLAEKGKKQYSGNTYYQKMMLDLNSVDRGMRVHKWDY